MSICKIINLVKNKAYKIKYLFVIHEKEDKNNFTKYIALKRTY